jgi:hypothetical protein
MSTAASHQREFVVEVADRNCGCLDVIKKSKAMSRRFSIVIMAEARDRDGKQITAQGNRLPSSANL